jgi:transposase
MGRRVDLNEEEKVTIRVLTGEGLKTDEISSRLGRGK